FEELAAGHFKDFNELIGRPGCQLRAIRTETDAEDCVAVPVLDVCDDLAGGHFDDLYFAVFRGRAASRRQELAVGREAQCDNPVAETRDALPQSPGLRVPEDHLLEAATGDILAVRAVGE